jgi:hypothetical protein
MCQKLARKLQGYQDVLLPIAVGASLSLPPWMWAAIFATPNTTEAILYAYLDRVVDEERRGALHRAVIIHLAIRNERDIFLDLLWNSAVPKQLLSAET